MPRSSSLRLERYSDIYSVHSIDTQRVGDTLWASASLICSEVRISSGLLSVLGKRFASNTVDGAILASLGWI